MPVGRKKHLAIVAHSVQTGGGVGQVALQQASTLSTQFQVSIVCIHSAGTPEGVRVYSVKPAGLNWLRRFGHVMRERITARRFRQQLIEIDTRQPLDFILYHSHATASLCHTVFRPRVKSGLVVHGDIFSRPVEAYGPALTRFYKKHSRRAYAGTDLIITLNPTMRARVLTYGGDQRRTTVVENGLAIPTQPPARPMAESGSEFRVLFVGRLAVEKDPLSLVRAIGHCPANISLTMLGRGRLDGKLRALVTELGLESRVQLEGYVSKSDLSPYFERAHVLCVPSVSDPLPTVVLEAMSLGLAVVGSDVDGIPHMVEDSKTGLLFPAGDVNALSKALMALANQPALTQQMGMAGFEKFKAQFSLGVTGQKLVSAINKTLEQGGTP